MRSLDKVQKPNWPNYLSALVFSYNATPHSTTGYQPYELMFGHKAPMPCNNWLGLGNYKTAEFKTKTGWLNEQLNALLHANMGNTVSVRLPEDATNLALREISRFK